MSDLTARLRALSYGSLKGPRNLVTEAADRLEALEADNARLRAALAALERWDMLALNDAGHGVATADAPWARQLIADALAVTE